MTDYLTAPPRAFVIPVTRGCDRAFTVRRKNSSGDLADWDSSVYISIDIDKSDPTVVSAEVDGAYATFRLESSVCDLVKNSTTKWRIVMSDANGLETALAVGVFERHDG